MRLQTLNGLLKTITEDHKAGIRFFTGAEKDFDPADDENYPAILSYIQTSNTRNPGALIRNWNIVLEYHEALPQDRSDDDVNECLDRGNEIVDQIMIVFTEYYGFAEREFTYKNITERMCFTLTTPENKERFIDQGSANTTGWTSIFTIQEQVDPNSCCVEEAFNTVL